MAMVSYEKAGYVSWITVRNPEAVGKPEGSARWQMNMMCTIPPDPSLRIKSCGYEPKCFYACLTLLAELLIMSFVNKLEL